MTAQVEERAGSGDVTLAVAGRRVVAGSVEADAVVSQFLGRPVRLTQVVPEQAILHRQLPDDVGLVPERMALSTPFGPGVTGRILIIVATPEAIGVLAMGRGRVGALPLSEKRDAFVRVVGTGMSVSEACRRLGGAPADRNALATRADGHDCERREAPLSECDHAEQPSAVRPVPVRGRADPLSNYAVHIQRVATIAGILTQPFRTDQLGWPTWWPSWSCGFEARGGCASEGRRVCLVDGEHDLG